MQDPQEMLNSAKENIKILNEYADPTPIVVAGAKQIISTPIFLYLIYATIFMVVSISFLYWRYKRNL